MNRSPSVSTVSAHHQMITGGILFSLFPIRLVVLFSAFAQCYLISVGV